MSKRVSGGVGLRVAALIAILQTAVAAQQPEDVRRVEGTPFGGGADPSGDAAGGKPPPDKDSTTPTTSLEGPLIAPPAVRDRTMM